MPYQEFEDASYTALRKKLLRSKGSKDQRIFLSVLLSNSEFLDWIRNQVNIEPGEHLPTLKEPLTESEFKDPPKSTEDQIFNTWQSITPADACRVTFWGFMTLHHVETNRIQSSYLAANGGAFPGGRERIDRVLQEGKEKEIDSIVRTVLRRMSGLPEARGNRSVYVNCPFARSWWRGYLADEVCENTRATLPDVVKVLRQSQQYWEELITLVVSQNSVLGDVKVRTALIWMLSEIVNEKEKDYLFQRNAIRTIRRLIGIRSAWQELGVFSIEELKELIKKELMP